MPVISPPIPIEESKRRHGGGGVHPPARGGVGDDGPGDGSYNYGRRLHRARLALLLALSSVSVLFVTLTVIFILTGAHAIHLAGGVAVLLYAGVISLIRRSVEHRRIVVEVAAWYWHFMGVLWIYIFGLLFLAG